MGKEYFHGIMVKDMKGNGHKENKMEEVLLLLKMEKEKQGYGKMVEELKLKEKMIKLQKGKLDLLVITVFKNLNLFSFYIIIYFILITFIILYILYIKKDIRSFLYNHKKKYEHYC